MSDNSDCNSSCSNGTLKRRISEIDNTIKNLTHEVDSLKKFVHDTELEFSLMTVRMKAEQMKALSAVAKAQVIATDMKLLVAEGELYMDVERLKNLKKNRLDREANTSESHTSYMPSPPTTANKCVQTSSETSEKKKCLRHSSSRNSLAENSCSLISSVDVFSEDVVVAIPSMDEGTTSLLEKPTSASQELNDKPLTRRSGSDVSISSSVLSEFNDPFTLTQNEEITKKTLVKKHKSDKKRVSATMSNHSQSSSHKGNSVSDSKQTIQASPKTVAELRQRAVETLSEHAQSSTPVFTPTSRAQDKTLTASVLWHAPVRHNMNTKVTCRPRTSALSQTCSTSHNNRQ